MIRQVRNLNNHRTTVEAACLSAHQQKQLPQQQTRNSPPLDQRINANHRNHHHNHHQHKSSSQSVVGYGFFSAAGLFGYFSGSSSADTNTTNAEDVKPIAEPIANKDPLHKTKPVQTSATSSAAATAAIMSADLSLTEALAMSDQHFDENQFQDALDVLQLQPDQQLTELKWRKARAMFKLSRCDGAPKEQLIRDAYVLAADAVKQDADNFACHKWMAILLDAKSELDGIKERVSQLLTVKGHMERAVELNPNDPTGYHLLGNFAFGLADMAWYQRKIVSAFFATPPTGTYEEALQHFLSAEEKKANFYSTNLLLIGKCYAALKNAALAKEYLQRAANVTVLNEDDKRCKEEATVLLKKY